MGKPYVIHIVGPPGSGKSFICTRTQDIPCLDIDDFVKEAFAKLIKTSAKFRKLLTSPTKDRPNSIPGKAYVMVTGKAEKNLLQAIEETRAPLVVVVGIIFYPPCDTRLFIKMSATELEKAYRRVMLREANKIRDNYDELTRIMRSTDVTQVAATLLFGFGVGAINMLFHFPGYVKSYERMLKTEKKYGALPKSQAQIIKFIVKKNKELSNPGKKS